MRELEKYIRFLLVAKEAELLEKKERGFFKIEEKKIGKSAEIFELEGMVQKGLFSYSFLEKIQKLSTKDIIGITEKIKERLRLMESGTLLSKILMKVGKRNLIVLIYILICIIYALLHNLFGFF